MERETENQRQQVEQYKQALLPLLRYLPWLEKSVGTKVSRNFDGGDVGEKVMGFPVYDGTLMNFVKEAGNSIFMDRNYRYVYTRNHIITHKDERRAIENATIREWGILCGILSKYVLGGRTKAALWSEAVQEEIFYLVINKMCEIVEYWDKPLDRPRY